MSDQRPEENQNLLNSIAATVETMRDQMATKEDLERMATKEDLARMATKEDLERMATKEQLDVATTSIRGDVEQVHLRLNTGTFVILSI